ncbi:MAG: hypothetical protein INQ03_12455 [Candidatus Heimdallarchaeota archaeon]|nr:hypothetical protein [Candidatus Heimdallarchaeota archaeon]
MADFLILSPKEREFLLALGEAILGVPKDELGDQFLHEADAFIHNLEGFLINDIQLLIKIYNARLTSFFLTCSFTPFMKKSLESRQKYCSKWIYSKIPLLRTGGTAFKAVCGWSYYGSEQSWKELNYPGKTLGREHETPTLLFGKEPWKPKEETT